MVLSTVAPVASCIEKITMDNTTKQVFENTTIDSMVESTGTTLLGTNTTMFLYNNIRNISNPPSIPEELRLHYQIAVPLMMVFCFASTCINLKILATAFWIKRPMSPTLQISLSLAGGDSYSAFTMGMGLVINSWLPALKLIELDSQCPLLVLEALRLGGIIMTLMHLLFLALNHYLGIVRPLHYASVMTRRNTLLALVFIWIMSISSFFVYFSFLENDGFQVNKCGYEFLKKQHFRLLFSSLFFGPFLLMSFIYAHIFIIVRRHQSTRRMFSRTGSMAMRQLDVGARLEHQQLERNVKALVTTLMILGSYLLGWMPGIVHYALVCDDCVFRPDYFSPLVTFYTCFITNFCIVLKTILNPIIYAARMTEIKIATMKMHAAIRRVFGRGVPVEAGPFAPMSVQSELRLFQHVSNFARNRNMARSEPTTVTVNDSATTPQCWTERSTAL